MVAAGCLGCGDDEIPCSSDSECADYGHSAICTMGSCDSYGITFARQAGLDPAQRTDDEDVPTYAAVLDEWDELASKVGSDYCRRAEACERPLGIACGESFA